MSGLVTVENNLEEYIRAEISKSGRWPFSRFMETALYHPRCGYYSVAKESKDYYTNVDVHPIFPEILSGFFTKIWEKNFKGEPFHLIELGCGNGELAKGILKVLSNNKTLYKDLKFIGIERSSARLHSCAILEKEFGTKVAFYPEFNFPEGSLNAIVYSNEFFDALPVERVNVEDRLYEITLGPDLKEDLAAPSQEVHNYFDWLGAIPQKGCYGEAHLNAREWIRKMAMSISKGLILTIDYGFRSEELYSEFRTEGTLLCHTQNQTNRNFYERIGEQDITAHVNFSVLEKEGKVWGMESSKLYTQSQFLLENGLDAMMGKLGTIPEGTVPNFPLSELKRSLAIRSLIHPEGMGGTFKVLLQSKGIQI